MSTQKNTKEKNDEVACEEATNKDDVEILSDESVDEETPATLSPEESLQELENQLSDKHNRLLRSMADMDNLRKRCRRDVDDALAKGRSDVLIELLPAVDSLDLALGTITPEGDAKAVLDGMKMVRKQFLTAMSRFDVKLIDALGVQFDPAFHEAVSQVPSDEYESGMVCQEMRKGYLLGDRLLRASMVIVSSGAAAKEEPSVQEDSSNELNEQLVDDPDNTKQSFSEDDNQEGENDV